MNAYEFYPSSALRAVVSILLKPREFMNTSLVEKRFFRFCVAPVEKDRRWESRRGVFATLRGGVQD